MNGRRIMANVTLALVLRETSKIAFADARRLVDDDGNFKRLIDLDDDSAGAIQELKFETIEGGGTRVIGVGLADKSAALATLMEYLAVDDAETLERIQGQVREILEREIAMGSIGVRH